MRNPRRSAHIRALALVAGGLVLGAACSSAGQSGSTTTTTSSTTSTIVSSTEPTTSNPVTTPTVTTVVATTGPPVTTAPGHVPGAVKVVAASPGGGSGEVMLDWNAVAGATGYRVERAPTATGSFAAVAVFDITTGHATVAADVVNLWSTGYSYKGATVGGALPDRSPSFQYVEYPETTSHCFRVFAVNAAGRSPASTFVCSGPPS